MQRLNQTNIPSSSSTPPSLYSDIKAYATQSLLSKSNKGNNNRLYLVLIILVSMIILIITLASLIIKKSNQIVQIEKQIEDYKQEVAFGNVKLSDNVDSVLDEKKLKTELIKRQKQIEDETRACEAKIQRGLEEKTNLEFKKTYSIYLINEDNIVIKNERKRNEDKARSLNYAREENRLLSNELSDLKAKKYPSIKEF